MESATTPTPENSLANAPANFKWLPFFRTAQAKFVLFLLAVIFYTPSIDNEYALDDGIIIHQNNSVIEGITGIGDLLTQDTYHSFYERMNASDQLTGGRYRPLPSITYAIEQEFIGSYRTGNYMFVEDLNKNGVLDDEKVNYTDYNNKLKSQYEYNYSIDLNKDGKTSPDECYNCWDTNTNFVNDPEEDLNVDGVFNEIDCQVRGAGLRHFTNILLYALVCLLLYQLLSEYLFKHQQDLAFVSAFIFTIHPVHSEVVANIRGRDDLLSLLFIVLFLIQSIKYVDTAKIKHVLLSVCYAFLALLAKEYALLLFLILPLCLYYYKSESSAAKQSLFPLALASVICILLFALDFKSVIPQNFQLLTYGGIAVAYGIVSTLLFTRSAKEKKGAMLGATFGLAAVIYLVLRLYSVTSQAPAAKDTEILNNAYLLASGEEALATKIFVFFNNLKLFVWPQTLISDYSYNSIEYRNFSNGGVWLSALVYLSLLVITIRALLKKQIIGFGLAIFFIFALPTSNLFFFSNLMYLESFLFHASVGLSIVAAAVLLKLIDLLSQKINGSAKVVLSSLLLVFLIPSAGKSWERSRDWKNDITLFFKDVKNAPNSVLVLGNAGARWIDLADTREITGRSFEGQDTTRFNDYNGTLVITDEEMMAGAYPDKRTAALNKGINYLLRAVELHPRYVNGFLNLGLAYYKLGNDDKATLYWKYAEQLYPNNPYLRNYYQVYTNQLYQQGKQLLEVEKDYTQALHTFTRLSVIDPNYEEVYLYISKCFEALGEHAKSNYYLNKHLQSHSTSKHAAASANKKNC